MSDASFDIYRSAVKSPFSDRGYDALTGETLQLKLASSPALDIRSVRYFVDGYSKGAPALSFATSGVPSSVTAQLNLTVPSTGGVGYAWRVVCQTNGGEAVKGADGKPDFTVNTKARIIVARDTNGNAPIVPGESTEYDPVYGWTGRLAEVAASIHGAPTAGVIVFTVVDVENVSDTGQNPPSGAYTTSNGVVVNNGSRIALNAQSTGANNGVWIKQAGLWVRPPELPAGGHAAGSMFVVGHGTGSQFADTLWVCHPAITLGNDIVGTTTLTYDLVTWLKQPKLCGVVNVPLTNGVGTGNFPGTAGGVAVLGDFVTPNMANKGASTALGVAYNIGFGVSNFVVTSLNAAGATETGDQATIRCMYYRQT